MDNNYALGIDTGGTFTDGVVFDLDREQIVTKTKVITTRYDLTLAINNCLDNLLGDLDKKGIKEQVLHNIRMACLSTTLATNATVEGQGADVGLILIGIDIRQELPTTQFATIAGGYDIHGQEKTPVDPEEVRCTISNMAGKVESFAVSGYMSVRNPDQELEVSRIIRETTGYPVVCGHQLSGDLGVYERTVTAVLNARLLPLIKELIDAVEVTLRAKNINAPVRIVKGDGSLISEKIALEKPIETILSGPAASLIGAKSLAGTEEGVIVDIGGTTTDLAILRNGKPILRDEGAKVGGWFTRVKAAEFTTIGLGGDSLIQVSKQGILSVGPQKVFPLSWSVAEHPYLLDELRAVYDSAFSPLDAQPTCTLFFSRAPDESILDTTERQVMNLIKDAPHTLYSTGRLLGKDPNLIPWKRLVNLGAIHRANLTPTDILHVTGGFTGWNKEAAELGVEILAWRYGKGTKRFIEAVMDIIGYKLFSVLVEKLLSIEESGFELLGSKDSETIMRQLFKEKEDHESRIDFSVKVDLPIIGVGAPVQAYLPEPVKRMNGEFVLTENADVANAAGTVNGKVIERVRVVVKPGETGGFFVYGPEGRKIISEFDEAMNYALNVGKDVAYKMAEDSGGSEIELETDRQDKYLPLTEQEVGEADRSNQMFVESIIETSAVGIPWKRDSEKG